MRRGGVKRGGGGVALGPRGTVRTHPPLLVLFPCDYDHLSFHKGQLVVVVGLAVVDGLHPAGFGLTLDGSEIVKKQKNKPQKSR